MSVADYTEGKLHELDKASVSGLVQGILRVGADDDKKIAREHWPDIADEFDKRKKGADDDGYLPDEDKPVQDEDGGHSLSTDLGWARP